MKIGVTLAVLLAFFTGVATATETGPYAGQDRRDIATLSEQDVDDLLAGRGWSFAKAAELNGYPGPAHVLELADALELSAEQRAEVQAIFEAMNTEARALGAALVAAEAALDESFEAEAIDAERLAALVGDAGRIKADLRDVHLQAHLKVKPLMSRHQIMLYNRARGYEAEGGGDHGGTHRHD